jgi:hypothetical protein
MDAANTDEDRRRAAAMIVHVEVMETYIAA